MPCACMRLCVSVRCFVILRSVFFCLKCISLKHKWRPLCVKMQSTTITEWWWASKKKQQQPTRANFSKVIHRNCISVGHTYMEKWRKKDENKWKACGKSIMISSLFWIDALFVSYFLGVSALRRPRCILHIGILAEEPSEKHLVRSLPENWKNDDENWELAKDRARERERK